MAVINFDITIEELFKRPLVDGGFYRFGLGDPEHTFKLPVGSLLRITAPKGSDSDIWAVPEENDGDRDVFSIAQKNRVPQPDGKISRAFVVHQVGKADIPFFHKAGNQVVRVYGVPDSR